MPRKKEHAQDAAAGERLAQWMADNKHTNGSLAKEVGATAASVRLWRMGTRPSAKFLPALEAKVGWSWGDVKAKKARKAPTAEAPTAEAPTAAEAAPAETIPEARKRPPKDENRDKMAGESLTQWMAKNGYTDRKLMDAVGKPATETTATVATWRKGTRPSAKWLVKLEAVIGFSWDDPPRPEVDYSAVEQMMLAEQTLSDSIKLGTPLDPNDPDQRDTIQYALEHVRGQIAAHDVQSSIRECRELVEFVMGHRNPVLAFEMITKKWDIANVDPGALKVVRRMVDQWQAKRVQGAVAAK